MAPIHFLSCDWGTTSFRLRWVSPAGILAEIREPAGVKAIFEKISNDVAVRDTERSRFFASFLAAKLDEVRSRIAEPPAAVPLVISGMASSSVGWKELPYATVPFPLDGTALRFAELAWDAPAWLGPTYLLSGVATGENMMRGEEAEILGVMNDPDSAAGLQRAMLILPGTHSKHVWIEDGSVVNFETFMTGELFEVLGRHSLLRASVNLDGRSSTEVSQEMRKAFTKGVLAARERGLAAGLFQVRTRAVLGQHPPDENTQFLSGLLVGAELERLAKIAGTAPVIIAAARGHSALYQSACEILGLAARVLPPERIEYASIRAHALFLRARS